MTFPLVCYCNAVPRPVAALFKTIHAAALAVVLVLCFLGLYEFPYDPEDHAPVINGRARRPRSGRDDAPGPEAVKRHLPLVEFLVAPSPSGAEAAPTCRVCLERLEAADGVRRLGNCAHAFHARCIDRWIDLGEVTCPLCRSHLLPRRRAGLLGMARLGVGDG